MDSQANNDQLVQDLMKITECKDRNKAKNYLVMANNNLENAISLYLELEVQITTTNESHSNEQLNSTQEETKYVQEVNSQIFNNPQNSQIRNTKSQSYQIQNEDQLLIQKYKAFEQKKRENEDGLLTKAYKGSKNFFTRMIVGNKNYGQEFVIQMQKLKIKTQIKFISGNFDENIEKSTVQFTPLILYVHQNQQNTDNFIVNILGDLTLAAFLNKLFFSLGFLSDSEAVVQLKDKGFNLDKIPCFLVFRRDLLDKIVLMGQFDLLPDTQIVTLMSSLKQLKAQFNKLYIYEKSIIQNATSSQRESYISQFQQTQLQQQQFQPNYFFNENQQQQNQQSQIIKQQQQIKLQQERELRLQQEAAYKQAEVENNHKLQKKKEEQLKQKQIDEDNERILEQKLIKKALLFSNIPEEPSSDQNNVIQFQLRMPDGSNIERRFELDQQIQTIFDYVCCQDEKFFESPDGDFDLIQNFPRLSLIEHKEKLINQIFQETTMEQLIVKEL